MFWPDQTPEVSVTTETTTTANDAATQPTGAAAASTATTTEVASASADVEALKAELAKTQAVLDRIKADEKAERQKRQAMQEQNGEYKALAESLKADKEALERRLSEVSHRAQYAEQLEAGLKARVDARLANGLPEYLKTAVKAAKDLGAQLAILEDYDREVGGASAKTTTASAPPATNTPVEKIDFAARMAAGESLDVLRARYPDQWAAYRDSGPSMTPKPTGGIAGYMNALLRPKKG